MSVYMVSLFGAFCCLYHYWVALGRLCSSITPSWQIDQVKSEDWDECPPCFSLNVLHDPPSEPFHPHIVDRIVDPSALPEDTASATHNSYKRGGPPLNHAYLCALSARASFTNDAQMSRKIFEKKWRVRVIYRWRADLGQPKWRALQNFKNLPPFSKFCPIFKLLTHFQIFNPFSNF